MDLKNILFFFMMLSLFACSKNDAVEKIVFEGEELWLKKDFHPDGSLKVQYTIKEVISDSFISHGFVEYYYPSGNLEYKANIDNGNKIGTVNKYFESGEIKEVWFYNPVGKALYSIQYNGEGDVIKELKPEQRFPQVIYKILDKDSIELKVYTANIPGRKKNIYLINGSLEIIDSVQNSKSHYDKFVFYQKHRDYQINADYYDIESGTYIETDNTQFTIEK